MSKSPRNPISYWLGIDAGPASIGWAVIELSDDGLPVGLRAAGVRRFDAGVEGDIERGRDESLSTKRRLARGPRRQAARRQRRLRNVFGILQRAGLLPMSESTEHDERHRLFENLDRQLKAELFSDADRVTNHVVPYRLRAMALDQPLAPHSLGRALYHLAQRRGFLSNLKANRDADEQSVVKQGISELAQQMGDRTLGQYFASLDPEELKQRIRRRWTSRKMYRDEFDRIWNAQSPHHASLDAELRTALEEAIFHQRPLKSQSHLIGRCELEPYKRRIPIASRLYQEFRLLQRVNDVTVTCPDYEIRALTTDERRKLVEELNSKSELTWAAVKKLLGMRKSKEYGRHFEFNFEQGGDKRIVGHRTDAKMIAALGDAWTSRSEDEKTALVDDILRFEDEEQLLARLVDHWELTPQQAQAVADASFEQGYGSHSRRAIRKLLPLLRDGVPYSTARKTVYPRSFKAKEIAEKLPPFLQPMRTVRNPAVARTMTELRKVINALIDEHGKPEAIRVELARDLKNSRVRRKEMSNQRDKNTDARDKARTRILNERGEKYATPHNILKVRLADECNWTCPYTGRGISMDSLIVEPQFDVEHIIPFSKSLDNSFANKTLCLHEENRNRKGGKTPFQAYASTPHWEEILQRVRHFQGDLARRKLQLFQRETLLDSEEFTKRQLSDTRYLSRVSADYLATLYGGRTDDESKQRVFATPGSVTKYLRDSWDLNRLLHIYGDPDDPRQKNRADHRHHAIDALLVAFSTPKIVADLNRAASQAEKLGTRHLLVEIDPPWPGFSAADVEKVIQGIVVSSRVNRKLNGALHKETIVSKPKTIVDAKTGKSKTVHHVRKPLEKMSRGEIDDIVDGAVKAAVIAQLERLGGDPGKVFADPGNYPHLTAKDGRMIPIHSARIRKADAAIAIAKGERARFVAPGDNHHMEVVAILDKNGAHKRWDGVIVSRYEANQRAAQHSADGEERAIVRRDHGDQRKFLFSLAGGEHLAVSGEDGQERVLRVTVISGTQIELVDHNDARPITIRKKLPGARVRMSVDRLREVGARKVVVNHLGKVWPAGD